MAGVMFLALIVTSVEPRSPLNFNLVMLGGWALLSSLAVICFVPGFLLAEATSAKWGHRVWIYTAVVLLGSVVVSLTTVALKDACGLFLVPRPGPFAQRSLRAFLDVFWRIGLAAMIYASHRRAMAEALTFQRLETQRTELMARLAEARLHTTRTRVQPEAFIAGLHAIRTQYLAAAAAGEAALDTLIARLRAASRGVGP